MPDKDEAPRAAVSFVHKAVHRRINEEQLGEAAGLGGLRGGARTPLEVRHDVEEGRRAAECNPNLRRRQTTSMSRNHEKSGKLKESEVASLTE